MATYEYLISLANFLANERVTINAFRHNLMKNISKTIEKRFRNEDDNMAKVLERVKEFKRELMSKS